MDKACLVDSVVCRLIQHRKELLHKLLFMTLKLGDLYIRNNDDNWIDPSGCWVLVIRQLCRPTCSRNT